MTDTERELRRQIHWLREALEPFATLHWVMAADGEAELKLSASALKVAAHILDQTAKMDGGLEPTTSLEQICRDLLEQAIKDQLISAVNYYGEPVDPQFLSSGDLVGMANLLRDRLQPAEPATTP